jgi:HEAT repeat protein
MESRIVKLAAAAVIIIAVSIGVFEWLPNGDSVPVRKSDIQIPVELAQMPTDQLLEIHFGKIESTFDSSVVTAAVAKALDRLSAREILAIGQKYGRGVQINADSKPTLPPALSRVVEACHFIVHARVDEATLDANDTRAAILMKELHRHRYDHFGARIKANVELHVLQAYPPGPPLDGAELVLRPVLSAHHLDRFEQGKEYLIALKNHKDMFWLLFENEGVYPIDPNNRMVRKLRNGPAPVGETWKFVVDAYDAIGKGTLPLDQKLRYWLAKLQSNNLADCLTAVEYFNTLREPRTAQELVMDAMERFVTGQIVASDRSFRKMEIKLQHPDADAATLEHLIQLEIKLQRCCFSAEALELLIQVADEATVDKMLELYKQEAAYLSASTFSEERYRYGCETYVPKVVRLALKHRGAKRRGRIVQLLSILLEKQRRTRRLNIDEIAFEVLGKTQGEDIDKLLIDMLKDPASFGIRDSGQLQLVWTALAHRGRPGIRDYIERFLADPENSDIRVRLFNNSVEETTGFAVSALCTYAKKWMPPKQAVEYLMDLHRQGKVSAGPAMYMMANSIEQEYTQFIPFLLSNHDVHGMPVWCRLVACALPDPCFVPALRELLQKDLTGARLAALYACGAEEEAIKTALAELEKPFNKEDAQAFFRDFEKHVSMLKFIGTRGDESAVPLVERFTKKEVIEVYRECLVRFHFGFGGEYADDLQASAILALGRLGSASAISRLKEVYNSKDTHITVKIAAALSLYSIGDDTGHELLEHFVNGTERSIPEIEVLWHSGWREEVFQVPVLYLGSPRTDALLLESFRRHAPSCGPDIAKRYRREILPLLVDQLSNRDREARRKANASLKEVTGQDFGFQPDKFVLQQTEAIERWRRHVKDYLAGSHDSPQ